MAGILTPIGWMYFPHLFRPKHNKQNPSQPPRYSALLLLDSTGLGSAAYQAMRQGVYQAIADKFGASRAADPRFIGTLRLPFRKASEKTYSGFEDGEVFFSAWASEDQRPGVVDLQGNYVTDEKAVFGGQLARFIVRPFAYDNSGNKGVSFILEHVQIVKFDMPRRDGSVSAPEAFSGADNSQLAALGIDPNAPVGPTAHAAAAAGQMAAPPAVPAGGPASGDDYDLPF